MLWASAVFLLSRGPAITADACDSGLKVNGWLRHLPDAEAGGAAIAIAGKKLRLLARLAKSN